jgi:hypothetical protein
VTGQIKVTRLSNGLHVVSIRFTIERKIASSTLSVMLSNITEIIAMIRFDTLSNFLVHRPIRNLRSLKAFVLTMVLRHFVDWTQMLASVRLRVVACGAHPTPG